MDKLVCCNQTPCAHPGIGPCNRPAIRTSVNLIRHRPDLAQVAMPLVRLMATADLSWADRSKVSDAVQSCNRHWQSMEDEQHHLSQQSAAGQQSATAGEKSC